MSTQEKEKKKKKTEFPKYISERYQHPYDHFLPVKSTFQLLNKYERLEISSIGSWILLLYAFFMAKGFDFPILVYVFAILGLYLNIKYRVWMKRERKIEGYHFRDKEVYFISGEEKQRVCSYEELNEMLKTARFEFTDRCFEIESPGSFFFRFHFEPTDLVSRNGVKRCYDRMKEKTQVELPDWIASVEEMNFRKHQYQKQFLFPGVLLLVLGVFFLYTLSGLGYDLDSVYAFICVFCLPCEYAGLVVIWKNAILWKKNYTLRHEKIKDQFLPTKERANAYLYAAILLTVLLLLINGYRLLTYQF